MKSPILGIIGALVISYFSVLATSPDKSIFINAPSIMIVLGGSICAAIITFGAKDLTELFSVFFKIFIRDLVKPGGIVKELIDIGAATSKNSSSLQSFIKAPSTHPFVKDGLVLINNDFTSDQIEQIMGSALIERKNKLLYQVEIMRTLAKYPPAFGMIGTVVGLIGILQSLNSQAGVDSIGPNMAVALVTTLYGLFLANYLFIPFADHLLHRLENEIHFRKIIIKGVLLIKDKQDPIFIQEMLNPHLLPADRVKVV